MSQVQVPSSPDRAFGDLVDALPVAAVVSADAGTVLRVNRAFTEHVGGNSEDWIGKTLADLPLAHVAGGAVDDEVYVVTAEHGASAKLARTRLTVDTESGTPVVIHLFKPHQPLSIDTLHPLAAIGGRPQGIDRESGVMDRPSVAHVLHGEVARCRRYGNPLAVMVLDLVGARGAILESDEPLSPAAVLGQMLADQTRWADSVGRWSEQRFLLFLPETSMQAAEHLVNKIRNSIAAMTERDVYLYLRLAAAAWNKGDDARALVSRAEEDMRPATPAVRLVAVN